MQEYEVSILFENRRDTTMAFLLEPWGEFYEMVPRATFTLVLRSPIQDTATILYGFEDGFDSITVYAWEGCTATLFQDGKELGAGLFPRSRVPKVPEG